VELDGEKQDIRALWFEDSKLHLIDQRLLPFEFKTYLAATAEDVAFCIKDMVVRGAPAIGCAAAYGYALGKGPDTYDTLLATRPTAFDLKYALDHMEKAHASGADLIDSATQYTERIITKCKRIGENGAGLIKDGATVLTHCNAGALATVDWGTALAPMRVAHRSGTQFSVLVDETRPRLQGAYLTTWELKNEGIAHHLISDNAAGHYMAKGGVDLVIVGADRICRNGDFANKIGTYEKAVVAKENGVPFYVAAPVSTIDLSLDSGGAIPIEERSGEEVLKVRGTDITPQGVEALNPAFDVTPARYVTGFITEEGMIPPEDVPTITEFN
jgi:translation initiation factor eIF-2B subunit alpha/methylthioribose-1-phosphate isomerase